MDEHVTEELNKHIEENYKIENPPKTKNQKEMSKEHRQELIQKMLEKSGHKLGIAPLPLDHVMKVEELLKKKGLFKKEDNNITRRQKTIKSLVRSWSLKNLSMTDEDWEDIVIEDIQTTDNSDIIFLNFRTKDDVTKFTSRAKDLPKNQGQNGPRLVMFVDRRGMKRHKAYMTIAKSLRDHSTTPIQTSVRTGKNDYLLRTRPRGSTTPWNEIPPLKIEKTIPEFEIGQYNDIVNPGNNKQGDNDNEEVVEEEIV